MSWEYINGTHEVRRNEAFEWWQLPPGERSFTATCYEGGLPHLPVRAPREWREIHSMGNVRAASGSLSCCGTAASLQCSQCRRCTAHSTKPPQDTELRRRRLSWVHRRGGIVGVD